MTEHAPLIIATATVALLALLLYTSAPVREYLLAKRNAAENEAKKVALDILIAMLDDAVKVAVLAVEQTMPSLPSMQPDGTPTSPEARSEHSAEKLLQATAIVKKLVGSAAIAGTGTVVETSQIADRIEAAVNLLKRGKL